MGNLPRQKINDYYDQFRPVDVTFTKEVIQTTGLVTKEIQLKCASDFFPGVIYSASFEAAKVVANNKSGILNKLKSSNNALSIRFFFIQPTTEEQIVFLVPARMTANTSYGSSPDMSLFTLEYSSRPPDDLIEIMGRILEANVNFSKRREEHVPITPESMRKMGLVSREVAVAMDGSFRHCILRDLHFGGAKIITMGNMTLQKEKDAVIRLEFEDPREECVLQGRIVKTDSVVSNANMCVLTMTYNDPVPMPYKVRINDYIASVKFEHKAEANGDDAADAAHPAGHAAEEAAAGDGAPAEAAPHAGDAAPPKPDAAQADAAQTADAPHTAGEAAHTTAKAAPHADKAAPPKPPDAAHAGKPPHAETGKPAANAPKKPRA